MGFLSWRPSPGRFRRPVAVGGRWPAAGQFGNDGAFSKPLDAAAKPTQRQRGDIIALHFFPVQVLDRDVDGLLAPVESSRVECVAS